MMKSTFNLFSISFFLLFTFACNTPKPIATIAPSVSTTVEKKIEFERWQQRVEYAIDVDFDHTKHQYTGKQRVVYYNNSPDALNKAFFHLYMNAFQPNSAMDVRSRYIADPDPRVGSRISLLKPDEIGYLKIKSLSLNGKPCSFFTEGTILEVTLPEKINPLSKVTFDMEFEGQVPLQIRRNGRMSREGVDYSMAQWYPKLCEYDYQGWHANPYIGREFYGVWGDFDVKINIDQKYTIGGTGYLQNPQEIGKGYAENATPKVENGKLKWHFKAENVHDFMWGADPDYKHVTKMSDNGILLRFFYIPSQKTEAWAQLPDVMAKAFAYMSEHYGQYPYKEFMTVQGGDGGMEYPMSTLITGERNLTSLVGVTVHEAFHSWYHGVLGSNESLYSWMDEGFTSYASNYTMNYLKQKRLLGNQLPEEDPMRGDVEGYARFALSGNEEPLSTHSDHFNTNTAFGVGSYVKGATFLQQLKYIEGETTFNKAMLDYFDTWKFKHPNPNDLIRVHEKASGLELDWFKEYFVYTTHTIDYAVESVLDQGKKTQVKIKRAGLMPMPLDIVVTYENGSKVLYYIPLELMRGEKPNETSLNRVILPDWEWVMLNYTFDIDTTKSKIKNIEIDPSQRLADVHRENNIWNKE